jgi:hypothetical protein
LSTTFGELTANSSSFVGKTVSRRVQPSLFDYMVVAINPALIMVLIGSLIYFLLELAYQGHYPARLHYCLTLFIFAAVLVARISMEEGWEHAAPFGVALAVVVALALNRFVDYRGSEIAAVGWIINYSMMGITWWCAQRLTWDCTLVDDSQDASGEGLLQTVGLDRGGQAEKETATEEKPEGTNKKKKPTVDDPKKSQAAFEDDDLGWATKKRNSDDGKSWWQRFLERRRRPHAPGVWVVYFSLAALPLFGIGQVLIPAENTGSRRYAFLLLCIYVACGLGLLLTTSFLGLRRYLRQRRLEMPLAMAGMWLVMGCVLIVSLLIFAALIPRPNAEYSISELPISFGSSDRDSSKVAVGKEGTKDDQAESGSGKEGRPQDAKDSQPDKSKGSGEDSSRKSSEESKSGDAKDAKSKSKATSKDGKSKSQKEGDKNDQSQGDQKQSDQSQSGQNEQQQAAKEQNPQQNDSPPPESQPESPSMPEMSPGMETLIDAIKWIFYGVVALVALWWAWTHREQVWAFLVALLTGWWNLWGLFGGRQKSGEEAKAAAVPKKSFREFSDPFMSGLAARSSAEELVRYSFEALEAWASDNGLPRGDDQTAYEFARLLGSRAPQIAGPAKMLAELYSRAAYSPASLPENTAAQLQPLWQAFYARPVAA